jgi:hypothetical protein
MKIPQNNKQDHSSKGSFKELDRVHHIDGRRGTVTKIMFDADGTHFLRVIFDEGGIEILSEGFFQKIPDVFSA